MREGGVQVLDICTDCREEVTYRSVFPNPHLAEVSRWITSTRREPVLGMRGDRLTGLSGHTLHPPSRKHIGDCIEKVNGGN